MTEFGNNIHTGKVYHIPLCFAKALCTGRGQKACLGPTATWGQANMEQEHQPPVPVIPPAATGETAPP